MGRRALLRFDGHILGAAFTSGDRFVLGRWPISPLGGFADVMWARPDDERILLAGSVPVLDFVGRHYRFDRREHAVVKIGLEAGCRIRVVAGPLRMELEVGPAGAASRLLRMRPRRLRERPSWIAVEDALLRPLIAPWIGARGVRTRGVTSAGTREWYAIHDLRPVVRGRATVDGHDLGPVTRAREAGFGFSEFPGRAALVRVTALFES
jgi:hypothetical protein